MRSLNKTIQTIAAIKQKRNKYVIAAVVMSLLVVLCVCYSLIVPAISMTDGDSDGVVPRAVKGEDLDVDEGIKQGHPFEPNIVDVNITTGGTSGSGEDQVVKVNFNLSYSLPANAVGFENYQPYIYYKLDDNIKIPENGLPGLNDDGSLRLGDVMDGAVTSGKYYITPEGYIIIRFTDEYLENHDGQDISGTIRFDADVGRGEGENGSDTDIKFNDDITVTIPGFTPEELGISKSGTNNNDGTISWTVTIANPEPIDLNGYYFTDEMLEDVIGNLKEIGYINDENYIERAVSEFVNLNNLSIRELKYKLQSKGIKADMIEDYIYNHMDVLEEYEINSAKNIIVKKQNSMEEQKLIQSLLKKGYRMDSIKEAVDLISE